MLSTSTLNVSTVYPRWRGEHNANARKLDVEIGLSPLARGTLEVRRKFLILSRFIPAGAGNTEDAPQSKHAITVYPRWRGEHLACNLMDNHNVGLSPLARGTLLIRRDGSRFFRFIPAGAGNTGGPQPQCRADAVYPRWRGEHQQTRMGRAHIVGLSPLARGTP